MHTVEVFNCSIKLTNTWFWSCQPRGFAFSLPTVPSSSLPGSRSIPKHTYMSS